MNMEKILSVSLEICIEMTFFCFFYSDAVFVWARVYGGVVYYHIYNLTTVENLILAGAYDLHLLTTVPFTFPKQRMASSMKRAARNE